MMNPTHSIHTHCQVAQKTSRTSQNLSKSMAAPTLKKMVTKFEMINKRKIKNESTTMYISNGRQSAINETNMYNLTMVQV